MFKVGDRVRCVDSTGSILQHDYVYRVEEVSDEGRFVRLFDSELYWGWSWASSRFVLANTAFKGNKHATAS